jgi:hypothetical protein
MLGLETQAGAKGDNTLQTPKEKRTDVCVFSGLPRTRKSSVQTRKSREGGLLGMRYCSHFIFYKAMENKSKTKNKTHS